MSYTNKDVDNGIAYSNNRYRLRIINKLYQKWPHLISHMEYSIEQADLDIDYYYPSTFKSKAIKVTTNIPELLCRKLSCNSAMAEKSCTKDTPASYYIIGDQPNFELQCQPSCYNLLQDPVIDKDTGEEQVHMVRLNYNPKFGCVITPTSNIWHERPFYRSDTVYEHRLNDLPTGFNMAPRDPYSYSGITYEYNKSYCDSYYDQWDANKRTCIKKWWEVVLYAVVGESIIKMVKAGIQSINNGYKSDYPPVHFPDIPDVEHIWSVKGWREDINTSFILPPIDYELPENELVVFRETKKTRDMKIPLLFHEKSLNFIKTIKNKQRQINSKLRRKLETYYDVKLNAFEHDEIQRVKNCNKKYPSIFFVNKETGEEETASNIITSIMNSLLSSVFSPAFWIDMGLGVTTDVILDQLKIIFRKLANDIIPKLTEKLLQYTSKVLSKVFAKSVYATIANTASKIVIKTVSKVMIKLTKLMAEVASVVGIILAIISIMDILLTIWDPLGFNNKFDQEIINSVTRSSDIAMRQDLEVAVPMMNFDILSNICLSTEEILDESLNSFIYVYEYLNALTVNSEGSRIDKGVEIDLDLNDETVNDVIADTKLITPKEIYDYEYDHNDRMTFFKVSSKLTGIFLVTGIIFMLMDIWFMVVIFIILAIASTIITYLNISTLNVGKLLKDSKIMEDLIT